MSITLLPKALRFFYLLFFFFTFFLTHIGNHGPLLQGYSWWKSLQSFFDLCGLYVACNVVKGFKGFWKKGYEGSKDCVWVFYYSITKSSIWFYERHFKHLLRSFFYYEQSVTCNIIFDLITYFSLLNFLSFFLSFFSFSWNFFLRRFWHVP